MAHNSQRLKRQLSNDEGDTQVKRRRSKRLKLKKSKQTAQPQPRDIYKIKLCSDFNIDGKNNGKNAGNDWIQFAEFEQFSTKGHIAESCFHLEQECFHAPMEDKDREMIDGILACRFERKDGSHESVAACLYRLRDFDDAKQNVANWNRAKIVADDLDAHDIELWLKKNQNLSVQDFQDLAADKKIIWVESFVVKDRFRKSGLGSALLRNLMATLPTTTLIGLECVPTGYLFWVKMNFFMLDEDEEEKTRQMVRRITAPVDEVGYHNEWGKNKQIIENEVDFKEFEMITHNEYLEDGPHSKESEVKCDCCMHKRACYTHEGIGGGQVCSNMEEDMECTAENCSNPFNCFNQELQNWRKNNLNIKETGERGLGAFAKYDLKANDFVVEYVGVEKRKMDESDYYGIMSEKYGVYLSAQDKGNLARFVNHICGQKNANVCSTWLLVGGWWRCALYATKDIDEGSELLMNYNCDEKLRECKCGSAECSGFF